jgi:hypothetical protein
MEECVGVVAGLVRRVLTLVSFVEAGVDRGECVAGLDGGMVQSLAAE